MKDIQSLEATEESSTKLQIPIDAKLSSQLLSYASKQSKDQRKADSEKFASRANMISQFFVYLGSVINITE